MAEPLVVLLVDGADRRVVDALLDTGRLPALAALRARGTSVAFDTVADVIEEAVWPSLLSGQPPGDHAALFFREFDPVTMGLRPSREADVEPFWLHLPDQGAGGLVLEAPQLHLHPRSRAEQTCGWHHWSAPHAPAYSSPRLRRDLREHRPPRALAEFDHPPTLDDERRLSRDLVTSAAVRGGAVVRLAGNRPFVCAGVHELHAVAHCLAHHYEPGHWYRPSAPDAALVTAPYEAVDRALAPLLDRRDANVVVVLTQGFRPASPAANLLEPLLERAGLLRRNVGITGGGGRRAALTNALRNVVPERARERLASRLLPAGVQAAVESRAFADRYDWSATKVFPLPTWTNGYLRLNVAGREAAGIVDPADCDAVLDRVCVLLRDTVDADTGRPLVADVVRMRDAFPGEREARWPDLLVTWAADHPVGRASHPTLGTWDAPSMPPRWRWSEHRRGGVAVLAGPGVRGGGIEAEGDMLGLAPTLLALAGVSRPSTMPAPAWSDALA